MKNTTEKRGRKPGTQHPGIGHVCGECARGVWNDICFDYQGKPFLIYCEYATYAYSPRMGMPTCFADHAACRHFEEGKKGGVS